MSAEIRQRKILSIRFLSKTRISFRGKGKKFQIVKRALYFFEPKSSHTPKIMTTEMNGTFEFIHKKSFKYHFSNQSKWSFGKEKKIFPNTMMLVLGFFCVGNNAPGLQLIKDTNRL